MAGKGMYVYILTNNKRSVLYIGVTGNLQRRILEHWNGKGEELSFTGRYFVHHLLYYETYQGERAAISREKELKGWSRKKKMLLISSQNPDLHFLNEEVLGYWPP